MMSRIFRRKNNKKPAQIKEEIAYTYDNFVNICQDLRALSNNLNQKNKSTVCEKIENLTEFIIWGDKNSDDFWCYFCEQDILLLLLNTMKRTGMKEISIASLQAISMMLSNISKQENINYLLSHSRLNDFIIYNYNFLDEEIVDYFVALLKSIGVRLTPQNVSLFFNYKLSYFPLIYQASKFYNYPEQMIRTAMRTVLLGGMKLENQQPQLFQYWISFPFVTFYVHYACNLREQWLRIFEASSLVDIIDDQIDSLLFLSDIYDFCPNSKNILDHALLVYNIAPTVLAGFLYSKKYTLSLPLAIFLLIHIIRTLPGSSLPDFIAQVIFSPKITQNIINMLEQKPPSPESFSFKWCYQDFWDNNFNLVIKESSKVFDEEVESVEPAQIAYHEYHKLKENLQLDNIKNSITMHYFDESQEVDNPLFHAMMQLLLTKDDRLLFLTLCLLQQVIESKNISSAVKLKCNLLPNKKFIEEYSHLPLSLINIFQVDPPLRLCCLIQTIKVLTILLKDQEDQIIMNQPQILAFTECFQLCILRIKSQMKSSSYSEAVIHIFTKSAIEYYKKFDQIKPSIDHVSLLSEYYELKDDVPFMFKMPQRTNEIAQLDIGMFFVLYKMMSQLKNFNDDIDFTIETINQTNSWREGENYDPSDRKLIPCQIVAKTINDQLKLFNSGPCYIVEDDENFMIVTPDVTKQKWANLNHIFKLKHIEFTIDPRANFNYVLSVSVVPPNKKYFDLRLEFENNALALKAKHTLESKRVEQKDTLKERVLHILKKCQDNLTSLISESIISELGIKQTANKIEEEEEKTYQPLPENEEELPTIKFKQSEDENKPIITENFQSNSNQEMKIEEQLVQIIEEQETANEQQSEEQNAVKETLTEQNQFQRKLETEQEEHDSEIHQITEEYYKQSDNMFPEVDKQSDNPDKQSDNNKFPDLDKQIDNKFPDVDRQSDNKLPDKQSDDKLPDIIELNQEDLLQQDLKNQFEVISPKSKEDQQVEHEQNKATSNDPSLEQVISLHSSEKQQSSEDSTEQLKQEIKDEENQSSADMEKLQ